MKITTLSISKIEEYKSGSYRDGTVKHILRGLQTQGFALTDKGKVLGFLVRDLPDTLKGVPHETQVLAHPIARKTIESWQVCELTYYGRTRAWFITAELQGHLPLPVMPFILEQAS